MQRENVSFLAGKNILEGIMTLPEKAGPLPGVVICHPHTLYGGDMYNNVVAVMEAGLTEQGIAVLRFNFRGAGNSQGRFSEGLGEEEDVLAALDLLGKSAQLDPAKLGLAGYSFGGMVALKAAQHAEKLRGIATVSPVVSPGLFKTVQCPLFVICGEADDVTPLNRIREKLQNTKTNYTLETVPGADHFWMGLEKTVARLSGQFFQALFNPGRC